ncbi:hypothetical protein PUR34_11520 [Streptomyces sp. JV185]|uniref:hypothetical protein n=1 Tax=Streptomyces sp. JV185 TaxID=858638 RepID=UPI002E780F3D|nr:hypothetical protein [Streptomyces sp. JV185]MEE1768773.1 hypothetical protein [Streptomyces sp. JV185]
MDSTWTERLANVVHVEAACWAGSQPPGAVSEIIEIGLTVIALDAGERLARHRILVRPVQSTVSEFRTELTGLTQYEVEQRTDTSTADNGLQRIVTESTGAGSRSDAPRPRARHPGGTTCATSAARLSTTGYRPRLSLSHPPGRMGPGPPRRRPRPASAGPTTTVVRPARRHPAPARATLAVLCA